MSAETSSIEVKPPEERQRDLPALTGMRIIAALLVFLSHVVYPMTTGNQNPTTPFKDPGVTENLVWFFSPGGSIGVSFFFILSGFVITWSSRPGSSTGAYYRRRVVKILPNHVVTWGLAMLLFAASYTPAYGLLNLILVNSFSPDPMNWGGANMPAWSLSSEMLFYLLFPLLIIPIRKIRDSRLWTWAAIAVAAMAAVCVVTLTLVPDAPVFPGDVLSLNQFWFVYMFPPARLVEFVFGMILARIVMRGRWPRIGFVPVTVLLVLGYAAALYLPPPWNLTLATSIPFGLAIGTFAKANLEGRRTVMGTRPMVWLGNVSFGFYMTQAVVLFWLVPTVLGTWASFDVLGGTLLVLAYTGVNVVAGWLLWKFVETPAMKYLSRSRKRPADRPPVAPAQEPQVSAQTTPA
ncbi:acyltransferase [Sphaerisporangium krabiense]|uniref:Peptidoglycan/LPS O-acetylase OafA/YrhL n=1 Tax=Sphaerisporangium krabiense TaxID=763782 RepID=A0A7W9DT23_9ACTN|nr:acyltransferase [Sphaerisporangium krabiense]MBB5630186.1 peptidoglycan/LPS O-acetylase OafA/YrhL [Sphaerisporangium krabiense]GII65137.1 acyltransferase [Sphaerisporangium krabiense]